MENKAAKVGEQFNSVAKEYDEGRRRFIPCFDDFYEGTTDFVVHSVPAPGRILDLGAGTGLLTAYWYRHLPNAEYTLVDIADKMLDVARLRFQGIGNITYESLDYSRSLPGAEFDAVISAVSIHHIGHEEKRALFRRIYEKLPDGGFFVNYDQFRADSNLINDMLEHYWTHKLEHSGLSEQDLAHWRERQELECECSVTDELEWLKDAGFRQVQCIYTHQKFSVLLAVK